MIQYPLAVGGILTRVIESGAGGPLVFVHGLGARADRWRGTVETFGREGFRAIAFDLPGHGFATKGGELPYSVPFYAECLRSVLDALGIGAVFVVGTSLGGHVAAAFACGAPERVRGLMLVGAVGLVPLGREAAEAVRRNVRLTGRADIDAKLRFVLADPAHVTPDLVEEEWRVNNSPGAAEAFERLGDYLVAEIDAHNVLERLSALRGCFPIRLVWGSEDRPVPASIGEEAAKRLELPPPAIIAAAGHAPYLERPSEFAAELRSFLAAARAGRGA
ncbi:MAG: alpha/beta fold hydrolase [Rhodospirillales bacterium]|nr:alpha/beta fold hydrolase [Rhodospirillales bacterium]